MKKLTRDFYQRETSLVAKELLGQHLVHHTDAGIRIGRIVEVEAYLGQHDLAAHSSKGLTKRTSVMFGQAGFAYIYLIYGKYHCFNVVTDAEGVGAAVLIRALEPLTNINERTKGPGLLCQAMGIDRRHNAQDLLGEKLFIAEGEGVAEDILESPRIGVGYAKEWALAPLRFYVQGNRFVSPSSPAHLP